MLADEVEENGKPEGWKQRERRFESCYFFTLKWKSCGWRGNKNCVSLHECCICQSLDVPGVMLRRGCLTADRKSETQAKNKLCAPSDRPIILSFPWYSCHFVSSHASPYPVSTLHPRASLSLSTKAPMARVSMLGPRVRVMCK